MLSTAVNMFFQWLGYLNLCSASLHWLQFAADVLYAAPTSTTVVDVVECLRFQCIFHDVVAYTFDKFPGYYFFQYVRWYCSLFTSASKSYKFSPCIYSVALETSAANTILQSAFPMPRKACRSEMSFTITCPLRGWGKKIRLLFLLISKMNLKCVWLVHKLIS